MNGTKRIHRPINASSIGCDTDVFHVQGSEDVRGVGKRAYENT